MAKMEIKILDLYERLQMEFADVEGLVRILYAGVQTGEIKEGLEGQMHLLCRYLIMLNGEMEKFHSILKRGAVQPEEEYLFEVAWK